jgi:hypothetical protein
MSTKRPCKFCGKEVDFSEPWCDHETMEESAWLDIHKRVVEAAINKVVDIAVERAAKELMERNYNEYENN